MGALTGVAGVAGGFVSDGPADGLAALVADEIFEALRGLGTPFLGTAFGFGDLGVCGEATVWLGVAAGVSVGFGVGFFIIGVPMTMGGDAAAADGVWGGRGAGEEAVVTGRWEGGWMAGGCEAAAGKGGRGCC